MALSQGFCFMGDVIDVACAPERGTLFSDLGGRVFPLFISERENTMKRIKCVLVGGSGKSTPPVIAALLRSWGAS